LTKSIGDGIYAKEEPEQFLYIGTSGSGTSKSWAEHPDYPGLKVEDTYDFDPNYQGPGDAFDWRTTGVVPDLIIPAKHFVVYGTVQAVNFIVDELHVVANLSSDCEAVSPNLTVPLSAPSYTENFSKHFAFPSQTATTLCMLEIMVVNRLVPTWKL
jgi:hypothetical protein